MNHMEKSLQTENQGRQATLVRTITSEQTASLHGDQIAELLIQSGPFDITNGFPIQDAQQFYELFDSFLTKHGVSRIPVVGIRDEETKAIQVIALTASGMNTHHELWKQLGKPQLIFTTSIEQFVPGVKLPLPYVSFLFEDSGHTETGYCAIGPGSDVYDFPRLTREGKEALQKSFAIPGVTVTF
jgi:hypothetical protein